MGKSNIETLTPIWAEKYLRFKLDKENKNLFWQWNKIVPNYLSPRDFCNMVNDVRMAMWKYWDKEKNKFNRAKSEVIMPLIRQNNIPLGNLLSLTGVFIRMFGDSKYQEYINSVGASIKDILTSNLEWDSVTTKEVVQEAENVNQTIKEIGATDVPISSKVDGVNDVGAIIKDTLTSNPEWDNITTKEVAQELNDNNTQREDVIETEDVSTSSEVDGFDQIIEQLKQGFFIDLWLGDPSSADMENLFNQALRGFVQTEEIKEISDEKRTELYRYLYQKHIRQIE